MNDPAIKRPKNNPPHPDKEDPDTFKRISKTLKDHRLQQLARLLGGDPKEVLEDLHLKQGLTQTDIAHRFHKNHATVSIWFKRFGIATILYNKRHKKKRLINSEARELVLSAMKNGSFEKLSQRQKELLTLRYLQTGKPLTLDEIAEKMGGISRQRVQQLERKTLYYLQENTTPEEVMLKHLKNMKNPEWGKNIKDHKLKRLEQLLGGDPKQVLEDLHLKQGLTQTEIAHRFHKNRSTVSLWFKKYGIPLKEIKALHDNVD